MRVKKTRSFEVASQLRGSPQQLWRHATSPRGVNAEFWPWLRMTFPAEAATLVGSDVPLGSRLFRSWILLFGVLPVDYDDLTFVEIDPGRRFLERSELWTQRVWEHERIIEPTPGGCRLTDRLRFEPRISWLGKLHLLMFRMVFHWRHIRLRRLYGAPRIRDEEQR